MQIALPQNRRTDRLVLTDLARPEIAYFSGDGNFKSLTGLGAYAGKKVGRYAELYGEDGLIDVLRKRTPVQLFVIDHTARFEASLVVAYAVGALKEGSHHASSVGPRFAIVDDGSSLVEELSHRYRGCPIAIDRAIANGHIDLRLGPRQ